MIAHYNHDEKQAPHLLEEHRKEMEEIISKFFLPLDLQFLSLVSTKLHDLGKKSAAFQVYVQDPNGRRGSLEHAIGGAYALSKVSAKLSLIEQQISQLAELIIAGHHVGLLNYGRYLNDKYKAMPKELKDIELLAESEVAESIQLFEKTLIEEFANKIQLGEDGRIYFATLTRFAMSAMVDADWLSTEAYFSKERAKKRAYVAPSFNTFQKLLEKYQEAHFSDGENELSKVKKALQVQARKMGEGNHSFYTLHAPTGSGKTIASLEFALSHAIKCGKRRIITALPLMNLTEEMSSLYRSVFSDEHVIEDHSDALQDGKYDDSSIRLASENWDRPFIVTTTNQLMESLFHNKPMKVRKLHRLYGSVIILDEYHKLPLHVLRPILKQLDILQQYFDVTIIMMSATPFALTESRVIQSFNLQNEPIEIASHVETFQQVPKRVVYKWLQKKETIESIAEKITLNSSVLTIVNTRKEAQQLFRTLKETTHSFDKVYHLSTTMCGDHRRRTLKAIKNDLGKKRIAVVSTSVLEAGIDISFPVVYRMIAPIDAIAQAAGRCNRYNNPEKGLVVLFELKNSIPVALAYKQGIELTKKILQEEGASQLGNLALFISYYKQAFSQNEVNLDQYEIKDDKWMAFKTVANEFKMIEEKRVGVICSSYEHFKKELLTEKRTRAWWREIRLFSVSLGLYHQQKYEEDDGIRILKGQYDCELGVIL